jgi:hypothetical protein
VLKEGKDNGGMKKRGSGNDIKGKEPSGQGKILLMKTTKKR